MRQELFLGWSIPFAMLFAFYSCSHEMDSNLESAVEEAVDLRLDQDSALTRSDLWEEEEESALEWAEDREGKCPYSTSVLALMIKLSETSRSALEAGNDTGVIQDWADSSTS